MAINREVETEPSVSRVRFWAYWLASAASTLLFVFFMAAMLMVPGVRSSTKNLDAIGCRCWGGYLASCRHVAVQQH